MIVTGMGNRERRFQTYFPSFPLQMVSFVSVDAFLAWFRIGRRFLVHVRYEVLVLKHQASAASFLDQYVHHIAVFFGLLLVRIDE